MALRFVASCGNPGGRNRNLLGLLTTSSVGPTACTDKGVSDRAWLSATFRLNLGAWVCEPHGLWMSAMLCCNAQNQRRVGERDDTRKISPHPLYLYVRKCRLTFLHAVELGGGACFVLFFLARECPLPLSAVLASSAKKLSPASCIRTPLSQALFSSSWRCLRTI